MEEQIVKIVSNITHLSEKHLQAHMKEAGLWDSLKRVEIILALEEAFDLMLEPSEIEAMNTVEKMVLVITKKVEF